MFRWVTIAILVVLAGAAAAQDRQSFRIGDDAYSAGTSVVFGDGAADVFGAGESVRLDAGISGTAHMAGRRLTVAAPVGGNVYAAGMDVDIAAPVTGNATLSGLAVIVEAPISGNLRAAARTVRIEADLGGTALIAGQTVTINGEIGGDVDIAVERLVLGENARFLGDVTLRQERGRATQIPPELVAGTLTRVELEPSVRPHQVMTQPEAWIAILAAMIFGLLFGILIVALIAFLAATLARLAVVEIVDRMVLGFGQTFVAGFFIQTILLGSAILVGMTGIGLILSPFLVFVAFILGAAGYVMASYALGVRLLYAPETGGPQGAGGRIGAALLGAALLALVGLVPFIGWWVVLFAAVLGSGAILPTRVEMGARVAP